MSEVINISDFAKKKEERQQVKAPNKTEVTYSTDSKYITVDGVKINFGGAFQRDIMKNLAEKREHVIATVLNLYDKELELLKADTTISTSAFVQYKLSFSVLKAVASRVIEGLQTEEQFNAIFDDETPELVLISEIVLTVMYLTYTQLDYQRMIRDRWFSVDSTIPDLIASLDDLFDMSILEKPQQ